MHAIKPTIEDRINCELDNMPTDDLVSAWNDYCTASNSMEDYIYRNTPSFFEENYHDGNLWQLVKDIYYGKYNASHDYVKFSKQTGHLVTFDYLSEDVSPYDQSSLVSWLIRSYGDDVESMYNFIGVEYDDLTYTVGDNTYQFIVSAEDDCCSHCCFHSDRSCNASDLFDANALPQCDEDGIGYRGYWIKVEDWRKKNG